jgi:hypothetical protein
MEEDVEKAKNCNFETETRYFTYIFHKSNCMILVTIPYFKIIYNIDCFISENKEFLH